MSDEIRFEAWTLPESGSFTRRTVISDVVDFQIQTRLSDVGSGSLTLPDSYPNKDLLLYIDKQNHANDVASLIRCFRGETLLAEWYAQLLSDTFSDEDPTFDLSGDSIESALDGMGVLPYDYPTQPTVDPDWIYGGASLLDNYDFEKAGSHHEQQSVYNNATGGTFRLTLDSINYTGNIAYNAAASVIETEVESLPGITTVNVIGTGVAANPWVVEFVDPTDPAATLQADDALLTGGTSTVALLTAGGTGLFGKWMRSTNPVSGLEHGVYTTFEVSTDQAHSGTHSLKIDGDAPTEYQQWPGAQQVISVTPGKTFRASVWVWTTSTTDPFVLIMRDSEENFIASSGETTVTASTWTEITVAPFVIPDGVTSIIFRIAYVGGGNPAIFYVDDGTLAPGFPQASLGEIMGNLLDDLNTHLSVGSWLTRSFTDSLDSDGVAWDQTLAWGIKRGQTLLQLLEYAARWGYEYQIRWTGSAHVLDLFNPNALGTDHSAAATPAIVGRITGSGPIVRRSPASTWMLAEGDGGQYGTAEDTAMSGVFGRRMGYWGNKQGRDSTQLATAATRRLAEAATKTEGLLVRVEDPPAGNLPLEDILIGDTVQVSLPGQITKAAYRVAAITVSNGTTPVYEYHLSSQVFDGDAAVVEGVNRLLRTFNGLEDSGGVAESVYEPTFLTASNAGITLLVAASDALQSTKDRADYVCDGTNDEAEIQAAIDAIDAGGSGVVELSEGTFYIETWQYVSSHLAYCGIDLKNTVSLRGQGKAATYIYSYYTSSPFPTDHPLATILNRNNGDISDMWIECGDSPTASSELVALFNSVWWGTIQGCFISAVSNSDCVWIKSSANFARFFNNYVEVAYGTGVGIHLAKAANQHIYSNLISGGVSGLLIDNDGVGGISTAQNKVFDNTFYYAGEAAIKADQLQLTHIQNNYAIDCGQNLNGDESGYPAVFMFGSSGVADSRENIISGNLAYQPIVQSGFRFENINDSVIFGNEVQDNGSGYHGAIFIGCTDSIVSNNRIETGGDNTYATPYGFWFNTNNLRLFVTDNHVNTYYFYATTNAYRIEASSDTDISLVHNHHVSQDTNPITTPYVDNGTNTLIGPNANEWNQGLTRTDGHVVYWDNTAGQYKLKAVTAGGAGTDTTAIHDDTAAEISAVTEKVTPADADLVLIEDSAASNAKKRVKASNLRGTFGTDTIADTNSTVTVTHGLGTTPTSVTVTPSANEPLWVTSIGATTFVINRSGTSGALTVYWRADG